MTSHAVIGILATALTLAVFGSPLVGLMESHNNLKRDYESLQKQHRELEIKFQYYREGNTAN
jgi:hypothetical protein